LLGALGTLGIPFPLFAHASDGAFFTLEMGYPSLTVTLDPSLQPSLGAWSFLGLEFAKRVADLPIAFGVFTRIMLGGNFSPVPLGQSGLSIYYFPFAQMETHWNLNDDVTVKSSAFVPYIKAQVGYEFMNFNDVADGAQFGNISAVYVLMAGVHIPVTLDTRMGVELGYTSTFSATDPNGAPISVQGFLISGHLIFSLR
jgi:hypothetical protein